MQVTSVAIATLMLAVVVCGEASAQETAPPDLAGFSKACVSSTNLSQAVCDCTAKKAQKELSPNGFDFVVASMGEDKDLTAELRGKLKMQEAMTAGTYMTRGPAACAGAADGGAAAADSGGG
jgi:hypothetical protein